MENKPSNPQAFPINEPVEYHLLKTKIGRGELLIYAPKDLTTDELKFVVKFFNIWKRLYLRKEIIDRERTNDGK